MCGFYAVMLLLSYGEADGERARRLAGAKVRRKAGEKSEAKR